MNRRRFGRQRGAITLVGAVFLIGSITVLLAAVQRMSVGSISDSVLHGQGVEALFIAESGLERAAWLYDGGTACSALAGETGEIGSGDFTVLSAGQVGTHCRLRVSGRVGAPTSTFPAVRLVEAELSASSRSGAWAAGEKDHGRFDGGLRRFESDSESWSVVTWDASSWSVDFNAVTCVAQDDCWAVGDDNRGELIVHWDGDFWRRVGPYWSIPDRDLHGVACTSSTDCWAVGQDRGGELIIRWDGRQWSRVGPYAGIPDRDLLGIHCVDSDDCRAVGEDRGGELIVAWDGRTWSRVSPSGDIPDVDLNSVYCVSGNDCWAVGDDRSGELIIHWNGSSWRRFGPYSSVPNNDLHSVHCASTNDCWAVGQRDGYENINHWDGVTWTRFGNVAGIPREDLHGIHMVDESEGYLVGDDGTAAVWDGTTWNARPTTDGEDLLAVTGFGGGNDVVKVVRWREVID